MGSGAVTPRGGGGGGAGRFGSRGRGGGGGGGGGGVARKKTTRVEMLDLEAELGSVRAASKAPVGEILLDVRQARRGLKQAEDELARAVAEEAERVKGNKTKGKVERQTGEEAEVEKERGNEKSEVQMEGRAKKVTTGRTVEGDGGDGEKKLSSALARRGELSAVSEVLQTPGKSDARGIVATAAASAAMVMAQADGGASGVTCGASAGISGGASARVTAGVTANAAAGASASDGDGAGVRKLGVFVEEARARLSSIEEKASECVGLCRGLGEFFGEGADEAQSGHIFRTLVQFLDLLAEAKKSENVC